MACGGKPVRQSNAGLRLPQVNMTSLEETGRLHFFYHSRDSSLPVRDVLKRHGKGPKKEPHLEKSAENYCVPCLQKNILGFLSSSEKYLFLFTTRSDLRGDKNRYVVGYLRKRRCLLRSHLDEKGRSQDHFAVQGPIKLVSFAEAFRLRDLSGLSESASVHLRFKKLTGDQTSELLEHFENGKDIFSECLREVRRLRKRLDEESDASRSHPCRN
jgi:hypothetical protein